jgi:mannose-6-phosphate isomerase
MTADGETGLDALIAADADVLLGSDVVARFGTALPYLLKIIAADSPLSLQVHPDLEQARLGYAAEEAAGIPVDAPHRNYRDRNHKPELVYALTPFEALCGFRAPRRVAELLRGLDAPLAKQLDGLLTAQPSYEGIRAAFTQLLEPATRPTPDEVREVAEACATRLDVGSPSPRADRTVVLLAKAYPGDPGVVTSLLLNPVTLQPGEAMFVPAGGVHAYLHGMAVEIMASSDNVLRAGLTPKHVDVDELLRNVDYVAAPPIRIAPEVFYGATRVFYAPVDDFELSVTTVDDDLVHPLPGRGPRILLCLDGEPTIASSGDGNITLRKGESLFAPASDGDLTACGRGTVVQADVP